MPRYQVMTFQSTAPVRPAPMTATAMSGIDRHDPGYRVGDRSTEQERAEQVRDRGHEDGRQRPRRACGHERGDGVGRIMKAIREREGECHRDGGDEDDIHRYAPSERRGSDPIAATRP